MLNVATLDFIGITDHSRYLPRRYNQWRLQQIADLLYTPGTVSRCTLYERSQFTPCTSQHRLPEPTMRLCRAPTIWATSASVRMGCVALRGKKAISIPHTTAWANKQVSWDYNDPDDLAD